MHKDTHHCTTERYTDAQNPLPLASRLERCHIRHDDHAHVGEPSASYTCKGTKDIKLCGRLAEAA
jgi:hypothetical protein